MNTEPITEAQVTAFLMEYAKGLLARYPQIHESSVSIAVHTGGVYPGHSSATVHLIGHGFRECGIRSDLAGAEADASSGIETPAKVLARAREAAEQAAKNLAALEAAQS